MKKSTRQSRAHADRRARDEARKKQRRRRFVRGRNLLRNRASRRSKIDHSRAVRPSRTYRVIHSPSVFCLSENPGPVLRFADLVERRLASGRPTQLDLSQVRKFDGAALTVLMSRLSRYEGEYLGVPPTRARPKRQFFQSGWFDDFGGRGKPKTGHAFLITREKDRVDPVMAKEAVTFASTRLFDKRRRLPGVYRTICECMANTKHHARPDCPDTPPTWWLSVDYDRERGAAAFSVVDTGVGIFESVKMKALRKLWLAAQGKRGNEHLLRDLLDGKTESATGKAHRGHGIPGMVADLVRGRIHKLVIIANDTYADVGANDYRAVEPPLSGTCVYWEYRGSNDGND